MALAIPVSVRQLGLDVIATHDTAKYEIVGTDMQLLRLHLDPGEKVTAEPGAMVYAHSATKAGCNGDDCCARCLSGSPCIMGTFEATGPGAYVGLTPVRPAKVLPLNLNGRRFLGKDRAYFASIGDVTVSYDVDTNPLTCCCGGQGLIRQVIKGDGMAFMGAMGVITTKTLAAGETLQVDTTSVVAWEDSVKFAVRRAGSFFTCCCAGEGMFQRPVAVTIFERFDRENEEKSLPTCLVGMFNTTLEGPGLVFLQSYSHGKFKQFAEIWALQNGGGAGNVMSQGGAAFGGAPSAADDDVLIEGVALSPDDVRRRGLPVVAAAAAAAAPMDRKGV